MDSFKYDVFLSYASEDRAWCAMLASRLKAAGVRVWFDEWQLRPGDHVLIRLNEALTQSYRMVAVLTENYFSDSKIWTSMEIFSRQHSDVLASERRLIPIKRESCAVPPTLETILHIDFSIQSDFEESFRLLLESLETPDCQYFTEPHHTSEKVRPDPHLPDQAVINPYSVYSCGSVVIDPRMFFGRDNLITDLKHQLCDSPPGKCIALYGQKRSGKSSILRHLQMHIARPFLPVVTTLGFMMAEDYARMRNALAWLLLRELRHTLNEQMHLEIMRWPTEDRISENPINAFREGIWAAEEVLLRAGWHEPRIIFLVDEFTYLYEYIKQAAIPASIMREWKALLEFREFSAVLCGQDSMPIFIADFPNEFGNVSQVRVSYFTFTEMQQLAQNPILLSGKTRYRGSALDRLWALTDGSPYYTQIICARLVDDLNARQTMLITTSDIDRIQESLIIGPNRLGIHTFDCLITAAGEYTAKVTKEVFIGTLAAIAKASDLNTGANLSELPEPYNQAYVIDDLQLREVIVKGFDRRLLIRVGLFAEWLRHNAS